MKRRGITATILMIALGIIMGSAGVHAQPMETVLVVHFDFDQWNQRFPSTGLSELWNDPAVVNWRNTTLQGFLNEAQEEMGIDPRAIADHLTGQMAFALYVRPEPDSFGNPQFKIAFAARQPGQVESFLSLIEQAIPTEDARAEMRAGTYQTTDAFSIGEDSPMTEWLLGVVESGPQAFGGTTSATGFLGARFSVGTLVRLLQRFGEADAEDMRFITELGIHNLESVRVNAAFAGRGIEDEIVLDFNGPRSGLLSMIGEPRSFSTLDIVPSNALSVSSVSIAPPQQIWDWFNGMIARMDPYALQEVNRTTGEFEAEAGLNLRNQILPALGQEATFVVGGMTGFSPDMALIVDVNDEMVVTTAADALVRLIARNTTGVNPSQPQIQAMPMAIGAHQFSLVSIPGAPIQIAYGVVNERLVITTSYNQMNWICQAADSGQSITSNPTFVQARGMLPQMASAMCYSDNVAQMRMIGQTVFPMMMASGDMPPEATQTLALLPVIAQYLGQDVSVALTDPSRVTIRMNHTTGASWVAAAPVAAAVAVPNFLEAQIRSKVSRTRSDMRSMATALESYYVDNNAYAAWVMSDDPQSAAAGNSTLAGMPTFRNYTPGSAFSLTSPIAYVTSYFPDVFNSDRENPGPFSYFSDGRGWILTSPGPDAVFDFNPIEVYKSDLGMGNPHLIQYSYDPTNGTVSHGDIWRIRQ